jgi:hypothetical protein
MCERESGRERVRERNVSEIKSSSRLHEGAAAMISGFEIILLMTDNGHKKEISSVLWCFASCRQAGRLCVK